LPKIAQNGLLAAECSSIYSSVVVDLAQWAEGVDWNPDQVVDATVKSLYGILGKLGI